MLVVAHTDRMDSKPIAFGHDISRFHLPSTFATVSLLHCVSSDIFCHLLLVQEKEEGCESEESMCDEVILWISVNGVGCNGFAIFFLRQIATNFSGYP